MEPDRNPPSLAGVVETPAHRSVKVAPTRTDTGETAELPEAYGTKRLLLIARDPQWLCAQWDLTREQQLRCNRRSADGHLIVRVHSGSAPGEIAAQVHVHPESRHWFIEVGRGGERFIAELGYHDRAGQWKPIAVSEPVETPPNRASAETTAEFQTLPPEIPLPKLAEVAKTLADESMPLFKAVQELREAGPREFRARSTPLPAVDSAVTGGAVTEAHIPEAATPTAPLSFEVPVPKLLELVERLAVGPSVPGESMDLLGEWPDFEFAESASTPPREWTPEEVHALAQLGEADAEGRSPLGSLEVTPPLRTEPVQPSPAPLAEPMTSPTGWLGGVSSPWGGGGQEKDFWLRINAELVVYGATEPSATVTVGGRPVALRPDGTFSCRYALPDGQFELPVVAASSHGAGSRGANLQFTRRTQVDSRVGPVPQAAGLEAPGTKIL